ncbi:hypothetical protein PHYBOEH_010181 [Phytophthora boehmeriae]|uniref:Uncharacterized protein n=1 Tax=Phytophthora boehmeriae TaxID=109152 RepID=A0A8T1WY72_9STRA|nr:hypothetical protein PHYBOEH_010181 [Phytophthora boehmeriae]
MKSFFVVVAALLASLPLSDATSVHIHSESTPSEHEERVVNQDALTRKQDMFYRMASMKSTPWDAKPDEKSAKCTDLCLLKDFWTFQQTRNCVNRPTSLCSVYKNGLSSMDVVLTVAECDCSNSTSASAGGE